MIAVTFALPAESREFVRLLDRQQQKIVIFHTGVGAKASQSRIETFLTRNNFQYLVSSGFAGGLVSSLRVGDLLLAKNFSDPDLFARAEELLETRAGNLVTTDRILTTSAERKDFARLHDAIAVDMETEVIARVCATRNLPMLSLRVISDSVSDSFPAPPEVLFDLERQKTRLTRLSLYLLSHPRAVVRLSHFSRQLSRARKELAAALEIFLRSLD